MLRSVKNAKVKGKKVLLRVDFNVPMEKGKITDDFRIERTWPTVELLRKKGAKIILISHLSAGRAKSLRPVAEFLSKRRKVDFSQELFGQETEKKISKLKDGGILLLENLRSNEGEEKNNLSFAKRLARLGDIYVNDAFSASHRKHASIVLLPKLMPSFAGLLFEKEVKNLQMVFNPQHPFLLILGGVKFGTKLGVLKKFIRIADNIFIGGALANNFFKGQGLKIGKSVYDKKTDIKRYLNNKKIILPIDVRIKNESILDCGPNTLIMLKDLVSQSKFVLWNGPLGDFEMKGFEKGTETLAKIIAASRVRSVVGGGDTVAAIRKLGILDKFSFVSTGGGAMLEFLSKGTLPGIEALEKSEK